MKWITREKVKVDRVACPWLIKKFVDQQAEFLFVPTDQVMAVAAREGATPYDVKPHHTDSTVATHTVSSSKNLTTKSLSQPARGHLSHRSQEWENSELFSFARSTIVNRSQNTQKVVARRWWAVVVCWVSKQPEAYSPTGSK